MLKSRILTAIVLIIGVFWIIFKGSTALFVGFIALVIGLAAWEWGGLMLLKRSIMRILYVLSTEIVLANLYWNNTPIFTHYSLWTLSAMGFFVAMIFLAVITYPKRLKYWYSRQMVMCLGWILLSVSGTAFIFLKNSFQGTAWIISLLLLTWAADTGAYFVGRWCGKRQFLPRVSPKKTWAGFFGGLALSEMVVVLTGYWFAAATIGWIHWIVLGTLITLGAVVGDLWISLLKRCVNLKDTGNFLPGHGGILDRIDSLLIASVVMASGLMGMRMVLL